MILRGKCGVAVLVAACLAGALGPQAARACTSLVTVTALQTGQVVLSIPASAFTLSWRHSVSLTQVEADYTLGPDGQMYQTEERFSAHGPGMEYGGDNWRFEDGQMILHLNRPIPRLVVRTAPAHENRLIVAGQTHDLTRWPGIPLELELRPCKD